MAHSLTNCKNSKVIKCNNYKTILKEIDEKRWKENKFAQEATLIVERMQREKEKSSIGITAPKEVFEQQLSTTLIKKCN